MIQRSLYLLLGGCTLVMLRDVRQKMEERMDGNASAQISGRFWLTAKAARFLGHEMPKDVNDNEAVVFVNKMEEKIGRQDDRSDEAT